MNLSKSKYCWCVQCNKILWLEKYKIEEKEEQNNDNTLEQGKNVGEVAKDLLGSHVNIEFNKDLNLMLEETKKYLQEENIIITEASFVYKNNFCSIDLLKKEKNNLEIYEVKSSTSISPIYLEDISYQTYILKNLGYNVTKAYLAYINNKYERHGKLELNKLFNIEDVTEYVMNNLNNIKNKIAEINKYMEQKEEPEKEISTNCFTPYECPFFKYCTKNISKPNIFDIRRISNKKKIEYFKTGFKTFEELLNANLDNKTKEQIDKKEIKNFLNTLSYPLYFLDFETFQEAIPLYDGIKPYMQIPFQYSLHYIEDENKKLKHKEFLSKPDIDPRRNLAESLVKDIPKNVCILAYNMSFERTVIKNLANLYPDLEEHLMNIHDNIKDLMIPFYNRNYYMKEMEGSYSIKHVLPSLFPNDPSLNYNNLELVHNGSEAMSSFANMGNLSKEEQEKLRTSLLEYCKLDTYAMVMIWKKLIEVTI